MGGMGLRHGDWGITHGGRGSCDGCQSDRLLDLNGHWSGCLRLHDCHGDLVVHALRLYRLRMLSTLPVVPTACIFYAALYA